MAELLAQLRGRGETVAVAESLTGGLLAASLTSVAGASAVFRGGLVVYATALKAQLAGVDVDLLRRQGAVAPEVARQLADGVRRRLEADWGVGLTGVAGPEPQDGQPVGTVYIGVSGPGPHGAAVSSVTRLALSGDRNIIRARTVTEAVRLLSEAVAEVSQTS